MNSQAEPYFIHIEGHLDPTWSNWLDEMAFIPLENGDTCLYGLVKDQAALLGTLIKIHNLNLKLVSMHRAGEKPAPGKPGFDEQSQK